MRLLVVLAVIFAACHDSRGPTEPLAPAGVLPQQTVFGDHSSGIVAARDEVIRDAQRWQAVWLELTSDRSPIPPVPSVDFDREMVVLTAYGRTPECLTLEITEVRTSASGALSVIVRDARPGPNCACPPVIFSPVHAVKVRRTAAPASFQRVTTVLPACSASN